MWKSYYNVAVFKLDAEKLDQREDDDADAATIEFLPNTTQ